MTTIDLLLSMLTNLIYPKVFKQNRNLLVNVLDLVEDRKTINPLEDKMNNKYPKADITHLCRPDLYYNGLLEVDIRDFITPRNKFVREAVINSGACGTDNQKAYACMRWVQKNITYIKDNDKTKYSEYWQFPYETLYYRTGDCEDQSLLLESMLIASGIPYWKDWLRFCPVIDDKGNITYHVFVTYYDEDGNKRWVDLDTCFYPSDKRIEERPDYKELKYYKEVIYSWNQRYCFKK